MISYWNKFKRYSFTDELPENVILVFGVTAEGWNNPVSTPMGAMYPHEVQANLIQTVLTGFQIQRFYYLEFLEVVLVLFSSLIILAVVYRLPTVLSGITCLGIVGCQAYMGYYIWMEKLILVDVFYSSLSSLLICSTIGFHVKS